MPGTVYLVGAGPGDAGLITVRGRQLLERAQVLVYDSPCDPSLLVAAPASAERIPVGRWPDAVSMGQDEIGALLVDRARAGACVVRLKNGDPYMFGRGGEEALAVAQAGLPFEVVPGVTSGLAAAAWAGIPLTQRGVSSCAVFCIVQSGEGPQDWGLDLDWLARTDATLVLHLAPAAIGPVAAELVRRGRPGTTPAAMVQAAGGPSQRTVEATLADLGERAAGLEPPTLAFIGEAVKLRSTLGWAEARPLAGEVVVLTRPRSQSAEMARALEEQGAEVVEFPCIAIGPPDSAEVLDAALADLGRFDWVVFSSTNGVERFLERLEHAGRDLRALGTVQIAAVGSATAEALRAARLRADAVPEDFNAEALARLLGERGVAGRRFLLVRAQEGREVLAAELQRQGAAEVVSAPAYRTVNPSPDPAALRSRLERGEVSAVALASPSAAKHLAAILGPDAARLLDGVCLAAIGPVTAQAVIELGWKVGLTPAQSTGPGLVSALVQRLGRGSSTGSGFA